MAKTENITNLPRLSCGPRLSREAFKLKLMIKIHNNKTVQNKHKHKVKLLVKQTKIAKSKCLKKFNNTNSTKETLTANVN